MNDYTAVISDAAQFHEEVSQSEIVKALKWVTRRAKQTGVPAVTVFHEKCLRGFASAHRYTHARSVDVWTPRQIELALLLALSQSCFSVSGETWRQRRGVPVGSMVSKTLCSVVHRKPSGRKAGNAGSLSGYVADLRHVDDTISLTRTYCRDCIVTRATIIYPQASFLNPNHRRRRHPHGSTSTCIFPGSTAWYSTHQDGNSPGSSEAKAIGAKNMTFPRLLPSETWTWTPTLLRSLIAGRITRWLQLHFVYNFGKSSGTNHACGAERATQRAFSENGGPTNAPAHKSAGSCESCSARLLPVGGLPAPVPEPEWFSSREA